MPTFTAARPDEEERRDRREDQVGRAAGGADPRRGIDRDVVELHRRRSSCRPCRARPSRRRSARRAGRSAARRRRPFPRPRPGRAAGGRGLAAGGDEALASAHPHRAVGALGAELGRVEVRSGATLAEGERAERVPARHRAQESPACSPPPAAMVAAVTECMRKTIALDAHSAPSASHASASEPSPPPDPPNVSGTRRPSAPPSASASIVARGKARSRSTAAACSRAVACAVEFRSARTAETSCGIALHSLRRMRWMSHPTGRRAGTALSGGSSTHPLEGRQRHGRTVPVRRG